ncbi:hypothetical protein PtoMrB4_54230 [Metapseudomonas otitidis]|uniref:Uncharacterized protein n=1 Tax=Metapseudomonas otitidis TaxID=319939 RepID=A0A679GJ78_9GAMM|nr:hypothetical protein PtoMrB4_54230 [Pseudomonas otitidis]
MVEPPPHPCHASMRFAELTASYRPAPSVGWAELCEAHRCGWLRIGGRDLASPIPTVARTSVREAPLPTLGLTFREQSSLLHPLSCIDAVRRTHRILLARSVRRMG